jgi:hypothetical protein
METVMNLFTFPLQPARARANRAFALALVAGSLAMAGCTLDPPGPSPIYSRLPPDQSGVGTTAHPLTDAERKQYDAIDKQVMADQSQQLAWDAAAQTAARYYAYPAPVTVYGGYGYYGGGYYGGGWGPGWTTGVGVGYAPMWGW